MKDFLTYEVLTEAIPVLAILGLAGAGASINILSYVNMTVEGVTGGMAAGAAADRILMFTLLVFLLSGLVHSIDKIELEEE